MRIVADNPERSRFEMRDDGELLGVLEYRRLPDVVAFDHVEVQPQYRGHGLGDLLVSTAVAAIRAEGLKIQPFCPFVADWLRREGAAQ